ncbi:hypothetical protein [Ilumatobacter sp.]|uniref:hypothetical protein n=1 Tax=Ilumatobacter sp. TaxID=1967498 RepID=UPI003B51FB3D
MDPTTIDVLDTGPLVDSGALADLLGWTLKPEGLCRDDRCVMVPDRDALVRDGRVDLRVAADLLDRPVAVDDVTGLVAIGAHRGRRRSALSDLKAPDFTLPDLDGTYHALSDHRSKKRLLVAFSSW